MSNIKTEELESYNQSIITIDSILILPSTVHFSGGITSSGLVQLLNTTSSSSTTTGALVVSGGVGVGGSLNVASTGSFGGTLTLAGATSSAIISCGTAPTQGQHLANKTYVDNFTTIPLYYSSAAGSGALSFTLDLTVGRWYVEAFGSVHSGNQIPVVLVLKRTGKAEATIHSGWGTGADPAGTDTVFGMGGVTTTITSADAPSGTETVTIQMNDTGGYGGSKRLFGYAIKLS